MAARSPPRKLLRRRRPHRSSGAAVKRGIKAPKVAVAVARKPASRVRSSQTMLNKNQVAAAAGKLWCPKTMSNKDAFSRAMHSAEAAAARNKAACRKAILHKDAFSKAMHSAVVVPHNSKVACNRAIFSQYRFSHRTLDGASAKGAPQQDQVQQGSNRNNNFGQGNNGQYGNNNGQYGNNNGQYGNSGNNGQYGNNNTFGQRNSGQYGSNYAPYGSNSGRSFDQNAFNRRYYGRYGNDPNNFQRNRQTYRVAQRWHESYPHDYVYADDSFYRDCRSNNEVGGAIVGAILGGFLGNTVSHGQGGATLAGVILGGVGGASIAGKLDCEDRSYVYPVYYDGFERGRSRASYPWRNDRTGDYGNLLVGDYYQDRDNYRCATYTQTIYVRGTPQIARGHACRQDDGTWALVD